MITIIAFLILLGVLVVIHEGGHFFVLRMCKVHVDRFSVGMGPVIYKKKDKKGTEFALSALPLGGYVSYLSKKALDAEPEMKKNFTDEQLENLFETKPKWQRAAVMFAGPLANFILAVLIFTFIFSSQQTVKPIFLVDGEYVSSSSISGNINKNDILLCDSGGQYKYGTTDVTRTICFAKQKHSIKNIFTKVLKGHIAVATTDINKDDTGKKIDKRARKFLNKSNLDYAHGTGHGVGFFLNVHEGPQSITKINTVKIREGMILSNEPGYYKTNEYGIRIENLVYVKKIKKNLSFQNLTMAPIEKDLINFDLLTIDEKNYLFKYHLEVYSRISKYLNPKEKSWLATFI